jgi:hypothetical protein
MCSGPLLIGDRASIVPLPRHKRKQDSFAGARGAGRFDEVLMAVDGTVPVNDGRPFTLNVTHDYHCTSLRTTLPLLSKT